MEPNKRKPGLSKINRILKALEGIYESEITSVPEKLQAIRLSMEALERRPVAKKLSNKDKALLAALDKGKQKKTWGGKDPNKKPSTEAEG